MTGAELLLACSRPAILTLADGGVRVEPADLRTDADVDRYHDWCQQHEATIIQRVDDEGRICGVVGCMAQAMFAVVEYHLGADCTEVTACLEHLAGVILTVFGLLQHGPQRPVWN